MVNFFEFIINFFESIGTIISMLIESLLTAVTVLTSAVSIPLVISPYLPVIVSSCLFSVIAIMVLKFLLGR